MIRLKGDITRQLNEIYEEYTFKISYKNELKQRILDFYNSLSNGSIAELLSFSKEYCVIENNEIKILNERFLTEYKEELFNSFNPLWYSNKKIKVKKEEVPQIEGIELEITKSIIAFLSMGFLKRYAVNPDLFNDLLNLENNYFMDKFYYGEIKSNNKETYIYPSLINGVPKEFLEKNDLLSIEDIFKINKNKTYKCNYNKINENLKKIKKTLEFQSNRFNLFTFNVTPKKISLFGKAYHLDYKGKYWFKLDEKNNMPYELFLNEKNEVKLIEKVKREYYDKEIFKILDKKIIVSDEIEEKIHLLKIKRNLIKYLIENISKIEDAIWTEEKIKSIDKYEELMIQLNSPQMPKDLYGY